MTDIYHSYMTDLSFPNYKFAMWQPVLLLLSL